MLVGGGTPSVLAQAALTQKIAEVQSKIEEADDKDCKDDASEEVDELLRFDFISEGILEFLDDIQKLPQTNKRSFAFDFEYEFAFTDGNLLTTHPSGYPDDDPYQLAASGNLESITRHLNSYYRYDEDLKKDASHSKVRFTSENGELTIRIASEKESAKSTADFANLYNTAFEIGVCSKDTDAKPKIIYENSKATFENNQVFIVTRLPRGSLDELLKQNAKAENQ
ncbi:MAG: hypothetical protein LH614_16670 [Pyrinomonadaceae bacterium]|nr:hypothetical protein [Pyrinomonadaceae bacterium]